MKKLILKKDVVARINNGEMNQLRGGADTYNICQTMPGAHATCTAGNTCEPVLGCGGTDTSGRETCGNTGVIVTNNGVRTCDICKPTDVASQCDTCYVRCNP